MSIEPSEYENRQQLLAQQLTALDLPGVVVVSRGGGTFDRFADVFYLTGHYQAYSYLPEYPALFSGRSHCVLVLAVDGRSILCVSTPEVHRDGITADEVRYGPDFVEVVAQACRDVGVVGPRVGLIGADTLPLFYAERLHQALGGAPDWVPLTEQLADLRRIKSPAEQQLVRAACATARQAMTAFRDAAQVGATEAAAVAAAAAQVYAAGAAIYFAAASSGPLSWAYASLPLPGFSTRTLGPGDLLRFDLGIVQDGYLADFGRTTIVGAASMDKRRLLDTLHSALDETIGIVAPGVPVGEIVAVGDAALNRLGVRPESGDTVPGEVTAAYPAHWGHGLGLGWERPWLVNGEQLVLQPGMVLAVERCLTLHGVGSAAAEQILLVTDKGCDVLTAGVDDPWT